MSNSFKCYCGGRCGVSNPAIHTGGMKHKLWLDTMPQYIKDTTSSLEVRRDNHLRSMRTHRENEIEDAWRAIDGASYPLMANIHKLQPISNDLKN